MGIWGRDARVDGNREIKVSPLGVAQKSLPPKNENFFFYHKPTTVKTKISLWVLKSP